MHGIDAMKTLLVTCAVGAALMYTSTTSRGQDPELRKELDDAFKKGAALRQQGKPSEAIPFFDKAAALALKVFGPEDLNTAAILNTTAIAYRDAGRIREAVPLLRASLVIRQLKLPKNHAQITQSLANLGVALHDIGQYQEAEERQKSVLEIQETREPQVVGELALILNNLGALYVETARFDDAERHLKRCLDLREKSAGKDSIEVADAAHNLSALYGKMGLYREAEALCRRSLQIREAKLGPTHPATAQSLDNLGGIHWKAGKFPQAEKLYLRSVEIYEKTLGKTHPKTASSLNSLALLYAGMDRSGESEIMFRRALAIREAAFGPDHPQVATTLGNMGVVLGGLGRTEEAEKLLVRSLKISEAKLSPDHPALATALNNLGAIYKDTNRLDEAFALHQRALGILETRFGKDHIELATLLNNIALLEAQRKGPAAALPLLQRALKLHEKHDGPEHTNTAVVIANLGSMYRKSGEFAKADEFFETSIRLLKAKGGAENRIIADRLQDRAEMQQAMGKTAAALQFQTQSLELYQTGLRDIFAHSSESAMHAYAEASAGKVPSFVNMAVLGKDPAAATSALDWTLRLKGAVFDTLCRYRQAQYLLPKDDAFQERVVRYRSQKEFLANMALNPPSGKAGERVQKQIDEARQECAELEKELNRMIAQKMPDFFAEREAVTSAMVQAKLPADSVLIEFSRTPIRNFQKTLWHHPHYFAFVLTPGKSAPRLIDLGPAKEMDAEIELLRQEFIDFQEKLRDCDTVEEAKALEKKEEKAFKEKSAKLHARLFAPLVPAIGDAKLLFLAADGALNRLPFEALVDADGKYLIERHRCAYLSSGRDLLRAPGNLAKGTVVFAGPDYKLEASERIALAEKLLQKKETQLAMRGSPSTTLRSAGWKNLPGAAAEAGDIRKALQGGAYGPVKTYVGPEALEEVLKAMPAPRILHLATHGFFLDREVDDKTPPEEGAGAGFARGRLKRMENPLLRSGIVLAGANAIGDKESSAKVEDGWVTAEEIALLNLHGTELVVLSACQTGLGDIKTGEGVYGLRRAFLHAGARSLVTSLFEVPDTETRQLMQRFYAGVGAGRGKLVSLHAAQVGLIAERRKSHAAAHPFFWASFVLVGHPD
jgi:CHAT domain-containing protein/tetratricopeptide (TPR) repeat protein